MVGQSFISISVLVGMSVYLVFLLGDIKEYLPGMSLNSLKLCMLS